jgi:hypothetical protein
MLQLQAAKTKVVKNWQKMDNILKMKGIQGSLKFYMVRKCWLVQPFVELSV